MLVIQSARSTTSTSAPVLAQRSATAVTSARSEVPATTPAVGQTFALAVPGARSASTAAAPLVDQHTLLDVAGARAPTRAARVVMPGAVFPTAPASRTLAVPAEDRVSVVTAEPRTFAVPH